MHNPLFINVGMLGGPLSERLTAARMAGFDQIEVGHADRVSGDRALGLRNVARAEGMTITDYPLVCDFDGACDARRPAARADALATLDHASATGAETVLVPASRHADCIPSRIDDDMRWIAQAAARHNLRVAYEPTAWSTFNSTLPSAWQCVRRVHEANLGIAVDVFHIFVRGRDDSDLDGIPVERIFLVQLSDLARSVPYQDIGSTADHHRLLPGRGHFPIQSVLERLRSDDYRGPVGVEAPSDELRAHDPGEVAREAMLALKASWLR